MANEDKELMAITPAIEGSGLVNFSKEFPEDSLMLLLPNSMR